MAITSARLTRAAATASFQPRSGAPPKTGLVPTGYTRPQLRTGEGEKMTRSFASRRRFIVAGAGLLGTALFAACAPAAPPTNTPAPAKPTEAPKPAAAAPTTAPAAAPTT